jgi:hypothetical protein
MAPPRAPPPARPDIDDDHDDGEPLRALAAIDPEDDEALADVLAEFNAKDREGQAAEAEIQAEEAALRLGVPADLGQLLERVLGLLRDECEERQLRTVRGCLRALRPIAPSATAPHEQLLMPRVAARSTLPPLTPQVVGDDAALDLLLDQVIRGDQRLQLHQREIIHRQVDLRDAISTGAWKAYLFLEEAVSARSDVLVRLVLRWGFAEGARHRDAEHRGGGS